jgi:penicillin-binding protein 1C
VKQKLLIFVRTRKAKWLAAFVILFLVYFFSFPSKLFKDPTSTVIEDKDGVLLGARIAGDHQWRFPYNEEIPFKFEKALLVFEDKWFYMHNGINPVSLGKAIIHNIKAGKIVSGGSTITMQVIRLARKKKSRNIFNKLIEAEMATRLELTHSKKQILSLYASNAPFGSNVVGLDAASWRYFGKTPKQLSWSEAATLAVLPNSPSLIYPGKNQEKLRKKRDKLLDDLKKANFLTGEECYLAKNEPLPGRPYPLPQVAPHLLDRVYKDGNKGQRIRTTIEAHLQEQVKNIIERYHEKYASNKINNIAALVVEVEKGNVLAYVGNTSNREHPEFGSDVDVIIAPRSTGSILKPFLYASMLNDGEILPNTLVADIPTQLGSFNPENYNYSYDGAVPAKRALARSLNVPAVKMLQQYGTERFNYMLKKIGLTTLKKPAVHYGLSIILGGAEANLWDLAGAYASMARTLNHYQTFNSKYSKNDFHPANYLFDKQYKKSAGSDDYSILSASSIWFTFDAMNEVSRPDEDREWQEFSSSSKIAWKTGTSYGSRDAWSVGCTPEYIVAVWVGNSDGEGRPGLTGLMNSAPVLFDIFKVLKPKGWFYAPYDDMIKLPVCRYSGYKASPICEQVDTVWVQAKGAKTGLCPYHQLVHLDATEKWRVTSDCEQVSNMVTAKCFVLPPVMEYFYKNKNPFYKILPPFREDCAKSENPLSSMDMIYPKEDSKIYIPIDLDGERQKTVFKVAHRTAGIKVYWYLDEKFIGSTSDFHHKALAPEQGKHTLTIVDQNGEYLVRHFEILDKTKK